MNQENLAKILEKVFAIAIQLALVIWNQILEWTYSNFLTWIQKDMIPLLKESVQLAFIAVAKITTEIVDSVKQAWQEVKKFLLDMIVEFENVASFWKKRSKSIVVKHVEANRPVFVRREIEEELDWDSLPQEVREAWLKSNQYNYKIDFMETREKELETIIMEQ